jgi:hypothetical protein
MIAFKPLLLTLLSAGTSSAFAVLQPNVPTSVTATANAYHNNKATKTILKLSGGAAILEPPPPELKVR